MCAPAVAPIAFGAANFATGAMGAVGKHQQAQAQADAANASAQSQYRSRLTSFYYQEAAKQQAFASRRAVYNEKLSSNALAAQRAYEDEQTRLNEIYRAAAFNKQGALSQLLAKQGGFDATGQSGRSIDRLESNLTSTFGKNLAVQNASLLSARDAFGRNVGSIRRDLRNRNVAAYNQLGIQAPAGIAPPEPVKQSGPSNVGLLTGLGTAALSGYETYNSLNRQRLGYESEQ